MTAKRETKITKPQRDPLAQKVLEITRELLLAYTRWGDDLMVDATRSSLTGTINISIQAHRDDHPKLVGTAGQHILALKLILGFMGQKLGAPIRVTLLDPYKGDKHPLTPFKPDPDFDAEPIQKLLAKILDMTFTVPPIIEMTESDTTTTFEIASRSESTKVLNQGNDGPSDLVQSLHYLFHAIGKARGRLIYIDAVKLKAE